MTLLVLWTIPREEQVSQAQLSAPWDPDWLLQGNRVLLGKTTEPWPFLDATHRGRSEAATGAPRAALTGLRLAQELTGGHSQAHSDPHPARSSVVPLITPFRIKQT